MRQLQRATPLLHAAQYKTYGIASPVDTHTKPAKCHQVNCANYNRGWQTILDISDAAHARTANWIRLQSGRHFTVVQNGTLVTFTFPGGQYCFTPHRVSLQRPEHFFVQGGDWRGDPLGVGLRQHRDGVDWVDDFAEHQDKFAALVQRG
jgi:hypothetical protein